MLQTKSQATKTHLKLYYGWRNVLEALRRPEVFSGEGHGLVKLKRAYPLGSMNMH